ncbi:MAG: N-acetyltransferase [Candidatus Sulfotelmatobacter sp.]|jgi:ribosomal protein S18 acetylase RimI-like enzyme
MCEEKFAARHYGSPIAPLDVLAEDELKAVAKAITLEPASAADQEFFYQAYASTRAEELVITGWNDQQKEMFLRMQFEAQRQSYLTNIPDAKYSVICCGEVRAGRLIVERTATEIHVVDIALLPEFRRRGIGSFLFGALMNEAREAGKSMRLFVEKFNPALHWYERLGFATVGDGPIYLEMVWRPEEERQELAGTVSAAGEHE